MEPRLDNCTPTNSDGQLGQTESAGSAELPPISRLKGRPLGTILVAMNKITREQVLEALEAQKTTHGVIGQTLVSLGYTTDADVDQALNIQADRALQ